MQVEVFIAGAGPTGLLLANLLEQYGVSFCIIDRKSEPTQTSNALALHARSLELLKDLHLADPFLQRGTRLKGGNLYLNLKKVASIDISKITSFYPFVLILPQSQTEQILEDQLKTNGSSVIRSAELLDFEKKGDLYEISFSHRGAISYEAGYKQGKTTSTVKAKYIIACDGAHSKVRELCDVEFKGEDIDQPFLLADAKVKTNLDLEHIHTFYNSRKHNDLLAMFPLPRNEVRLVADLRSDTDFEKDHIDIKTICSHRSGGKVEIEYTTWESHFWIHSKIIKKLRIDNIFFAGDAAHIHSPFGGQGMNTGMQDVYNLAWKLNMVINHEAKPDILDSYQKERYPVIQFLVKQTERLTKMMLTRNPFTRIFRDWFVLPLLKRKKVNLELANQLSMLAVHYTKSPLISYQSIISHHSPHPGYLLPEVKLSPFHHLKEYQPPHGKFWLIILTGAHPNGAACDDVIEFAEWAHANYEEHLDYHVITPTPIENLEHQLQDRQNHAAKAFHIHKPSYYLVRPDKYIAVTCSKLDKKKLKKYFEKIF